MVYDFFYLIFNLLVEKGKWTFETDKFLVLYI